MSEPWPGGFERVPDEPWTDQPVRELAEKYDTVEQHGWYDNLDPTVRELVELLEGGETIVDYSGGTGILTERLLDQVEVPVGVVVADSSRKFLRRALDKLGEDERVAFRLIEYLDEPGRLELLDEVLEDELVEDGIEAIVSTNAIHLYYDLEDTLAAWRRVIAGHGRVLVQSGNIDRRDRPDGRWIIDATVRHVDEAAREIVREDDRFEAYRAPLGDEERMAEYEALRERFFLPARDLSYYLARLRGAGFETERTVHRPIEVDTDEWSQFLKVYHEGVLGWVGGSERVEGEGPTEEAVDDRRRLIEEALDRVLDGADTFEAEWTYVTCRPN